MTKSYQDLVVWQKAMDVATAVYQLTSSFPQNEQFGLVSQMRRAAVSIASNIAEGEGRKSPKEFAHFLSISLGSKAELETQLILCERVNILPVGSSKDLLSSLDEIGKMLTNLRRKMKVGVES